MHGAHASVEPSSVYAECEHVVLREPELGLGVERAKAQDDERRTELDDDDTDAVELVLCGPISPST